MVYFRGGEVTPSCDEESQQSSSLLKREVIILR